MSNGLNKVMLIGHFGDDPQLNYFADGNAFINSRIATNQTVTDKQTGEKQQRTQWHNVCFRRRLAEVVGQYCRKGSLVYIEGSLRTRNWENEQGIKFWVTEVMGWQLQILADSQSRLADKPSDEAPDDDLPF